MWRRTCHHLPSCNNIHSLCMESRAYISWRYRRVVVGPSIACGLWGARNWDTLVNKNTDMRPDIGSPRIYVCICLQGVSPLDIVVCYMLSGRGASYKMRGSQTCIRPTSTTSIFSTLWVRSIGQPKVAIISTTRTYCTKPTFILPYCVCVCCLT